MLGSDNLKDFLKTLFSGDELRISALVVALFVFIPVAIIQIKLIGDIGNNFLALMLGLVGGVSGINLANLVVTAVSTLKSNSTNTTNIVNTTDTNNQI